MKILLLVGKNKEEIFIANDYIEYRDADIRISWRKGETRFFNFIKQQNKNVCLTTNNKEFIALLATWSEINPVEIVCVNKHDDGTLYTIPDALQFRKHVLFYEADIRDELTFTKDKTKYVDGEPIIFTKHTITWQA